MEESEWERLDYDVLLTPAEKFYLYITLPMQVDEDSVSVEVFMAEYWKKLLISGRLEAFSAAFKTWVQEGMK